MRFLNRILVLAISTSGCGDDALIADDSAVDAAVMDAPSMDALTVDAPELAAEDATVPEAGAPDAALPDAAEADTGVPRFLPSNADRFGELAPTGLVVGAPSGTFNTDRCSSSAGMGSCERVPQLDAPDACVCRMDALTIADLRVEGSASLVILAFDSATITGILDVSAVGPVPGPGAVAEYDTPTMNTIGGAGGSFAAAGGNPGSAAPFGSEALVPLLGGMNGQNSCNSRPGGGGGGAVQISAGQTLTVSGAVEAFGGGAAGGLGGRGLCLGGAGGGSGGAILLEAPSVDVTGRLNAGGGGGGGGGNNDGVDGGNGANGRGGGIGGPALDVICSIGGVAVGGVGGRGSATAEGGAGTEGDVASCFSGNFYTGGGGGGGSAGRIRVNTTTGCLCTGTFNPAATFGEIE
ncbi:MAG: hypothetical protein AAF645_24115 [Myxococcota bacterium]